jgi:hypothetical protein
MTLSASRIYAVVVIALAVALHAYEQLARSSAPSVGFFLWAMVPYALCFLVLVRSRSGIPAALGVSVACALDLLAHYDVFVNPTGSTAALALLAVPLWSALLFAPVAMIVAWLAVRRRSRAGNGAA